MASQQGLADRLTQDTTSKRIARNQSRLANPVQVRRRTDYVVLTHLNAAALTSSYAYGGTEDLSDWNEALLIIGGTSLVLGSIAGLKASIEMLDPLTGSNFPLYATGALTSNPTPVLTPTAGNTVFANFPIPTPASMVRVGFTATTAGTSGQVFAALLKRG